MHFCLKQIVYILVIGFSGHQLFKQGLVSLPVLLFVYRHHESLLFQVGDHAFDPAPCFAFLQLSRFSELAFFGCVFGDIRPIKVCLEVDFKLVQVN